MSLIFRICFPLLLLPVAGLAQDVYVPESLREWQPWVLEGKAYRDCPFLFDRAARQESDFVCAWPGELKLDIGNDEARFTLRWTVYAEDQWLALPGDASYWPDQVTANGRTVAVVARGEEPSVRLGPGSYELAGTFEWDERPGVLRLPAGIGLVSLVVDGARVERPRRIGTGLFLGQVAEAPRARDAVQTQTYRLVSDNVPTRLVSRLRINVSGRIREAQFGPLLPDGFVPLALNSPLPARLEPDGNLTVQVRPGTWVIDITARGPQTLDALTLPTAESNMPPDEIWAYAANDRLRVTAVEGVAPVDPQQVEVPPEWRNFPAFRLQPGDTMTIVERSRGIVTAENELRLNRQMWLDFDGSGYVVSDSIRGAMRKDWRLDMNVPYALKSATVDDRHLLVTDGAQAGQTGVEIRRSEVDLEALGRAETRGTLSATGWATRFAGVSAVLHLPPGHKLLAAPGVDTAAGSWASQWQLLDFFLVLVVTIGTWRLLGRGAGVLALLALTLSYQETAAPAWLWLNLLAASALLRAAPAGRLLQSVRVYQLTSAALLVIMLVPFIVGQLRIAIYPQLEPQSGYLPMARQVVELAPPSPAGGLAMESDLLQRAEPALSEKQLEAVRRVGDAGVEPAAVSTMPVAEDNYARYAASDVVQAGPGKPSWRWNSYRLEWGGPVEAEQTLRLVILPRWAVSTLRCLMVALLLLYAAVLAADIAKRPLTLPGGFSIGRSSVASALLASIAVMLLAASPGAGAQTPDPDVLRELERRLVEPPACAPRCGEFVAAEVVVGTAAVRMRLTAHTLADVALPLPGSETGWRPTAIATESGAAMQVQRGPGQSLWIRLPAGQHTIDVRGPIDAVDSVEIPFPAPPRVVTAAVDGWLLAGIKDRRLLTGSLQLTRLQTDAEEESAVTWESSRFPVFAEVTRSIRLDLDWTVTTRVQRVAPVDGAITLEVPLIAGEAVLTDGLRVEEGRALISMEPNQRAFVWRSSLPRGPALTLDAGGATAWQEIWQVGVGRTWHASFSGVPESDPGQRTRESRTALFYPRDGETLSIGVTRPPASAGSTLAFDSVDLAVELGSRSRTTNLSLRYRSTRGAQHVFRLPADAEIAEVSIDGRIEPLQSENGELTVPIVPGEHMISMRWRENVSVSARTRTPEVDLAAPASNIGLSLSLPQNRWLLASSGPRLGPAVLYWPELAALILFALILGRIDLTPLRWYHWLLLGLGFSTFSWPVLAWVVVWLLACGARERRQGGENWWQFNLLQVLLAVLTVSALLAIIGSLPQGLLGTPDMQVTGNDSYGNMLNWFADRSATTLPLATAWSVPLWSYKVLILGWALWLSFALLRWLPWVWHCFSKQGYWRSRPRPA